MSRAGVAEWLAATPGVVRVQGLGPGLYRADCERDLRAEIARRLAPAADLVGLRFAAPSLNEVYTRYFDEPAMRRSGSPFKGVGVWAEEAITSRAPAVGSWRRWSF